MRVTIQCVRGPGARLCRLTEVGRHGNQTLDTPMCMLYTRGGSAPHISCDLLKKIPNVPDIAHMPVNLLASDVESIAGYKEGMAKLSALGDKLVYASSHDPAVEVKSGSNDKSVMGVWGKGGRVKLDCAGFMKLQEAVLPDWYQAMSDCDTDKTSTRKRAGKAVDRTLNFLDETLDRHTKSERLKDSCMLGSLVGGYNMRERERCARETAARNLDGYVIEGFHRHGPQTEDFDLHEAEDVIKAVIKQLPDESVRVMHGVWRPDKVLDAVQLGVDVFDSTYPYLVTERGEALVFNYKYKTDPESSIEERDKVPSGFTINLNEKRYVDDFSPLLEGCTCYTCQNFTCAYVNHLLNTSELLSNILLIIHNFQHYFGYFTAIREALAENRYDDLKTCIVQQTKTKTNS